MKIFMMGQRHIQSANIDMQWQDNGNYGSSSISVSSNQMTITINSVYFDSSENTDTVVVESPVLAPLDGNEQDFIFQIKSNSNNAKAQVGLGIGTDLSFFGSKKTIQNNETKNYKTIVPTSINDVTSKWIIKLINVSIGDIITIDYIKANYSVYALNTDQVWTGNGYVFAPNNNIRINGNSSSVRYGVANLLSPVLALNSKTIIRAVGKSTISSNTTDQLFQASGTSWNSAGIKYGQTSNNGSGNFSFPMATTLNANRYFRIVVTAVFVGSYVQLSHLKLIIKG